jgi:hypothetical protein
VTQGEVEYFALAHSMQIHLWLSVTVGSVVRPNIAHRWLVIAGFEQHVLLARGLTVVGLLVFNVKILEPLSEWVRGV